MLYSCKPLHRESQHDRLWNSIKKSSSTIAFNSFINTYPLSPHFSEACSLIIEIESKTDPIGGCFLNAISCHILSEDSILIQENTYGILHLDSIISQILLEHRYEKTLQVNQNSFAYSGSYFIIPIAENKLNLQRWVNQINQGLNLYRSQIYNSAQSLPGISFNDLNRLDALISSKIFLTKPTPFRKPPPPPPSV